MIVRMFDLCKHFCAFLVVLRTDRKNSVLHPSPEIKFLQNVAIDPLRCLHIGLLHQAILQPTHKKCQSATNVS